MADNPAPATPKLTGPPMAPNAAEAMTLFVMIVATLYFGREVLMPVTLALLLAFLLAPLVELLRRIHLGRIPSVVIGVAVALGIILAIGGVIGMQLAELSTGLPKYAEAVEKKVDAVKQYTVGRLSGLADQLGVQGKATSNPDPKPDQPASGTQSTPAASQPATASSPMSLAERYLTTVLSPFATLGIVIVVAVFALMQQEDLRDRMIRLLGSDDLHRTTLAIDDGARRLSRYFITQLCINTSFGIVIGLGLWLVGVPNPVLWGLLSALLRFVPYVGSFIAALLPMALAAAVEPGWSMVLWTAALYAGVEFLTGQIVEPMVYGHSTGLSPFSVVVAAIFWSWLWGPVGLILSTPLTLCLVVMGRHAKRLQFLDVLLGDRPALTPVESFYQRILAGDPDETQDHAEAMLKECSLSTYYDEVAVKGLQMAAADAQRGVLNEEQLDTVRKATEALIDGLDSHGDEQPPPSKHKDDSVDGPDENRIPHKDDPKSADNPPPEGWRGPSAVLSVAGRGLLDEAAAAMLRQLVTKHGLGSRLVRHEEVARGEIDTLDVTGVAMVCVSYLDVTGTPAHLRYLLQRLRQRLPRGVPILVGLWPSAEAAPKPATMGADLYVTSLTDAVSACADEAGRARAPHATFEAA